MAAPPRSTHQALHRPTVHRNQSFTICSVASRAPHLVTYLQLATPDMHKLRLRVGRGVLTVKQYTLYMKSCKKSEKLTVICPSTEGPAEALSGEVCFAGEAHVSVVAKDKKKRLSSSRFCISGDPVKLQFKACIVTKG